MHGFNVGTDLNSNANARTHFHSSFEVDQRLTNGSIMWWFQTSINEDLDKNDHTDGPVEAKVFKSSNSTVMEKFYNF